MGIQAPDFDETTNTLSIPDVVGVVYMIGGNTVEGSLVIKRDTTVRVAPEPGYVLAKGVQKEFTFEATQLEEDPPEVEEEVVPAPDEHPDAAEPVVVDTAGSDPENPDQQAAGFGSFGNRTR